MDVRALLAKGKSERPSIAVDKEDDLMYDLGHLYAYDPSPIDEAEMASGSEAYLLRMTRENVQLLTNRLYETMHASGSKASIKLPKPEMALPREKPLPESKAVTRWERFAKDKGIVKKKRSKMVWDEDSQSWAPRFGYGRANSTNDTAENWVVEAKAGDDGSVDPFEARAGAKKAKLGKQKRQEERNRLEAAHAAAMGQSGSTSFKREEKKAYLKQAISAAQVSTASIGRFDRALPGEPSKTAGKRTQYASATDASSAGAADANAASVAAKMYPDSRDSLRKGVAVDRGKLKVAQPAAKGATSQKGSSKRAAQGKPKRK